MYSNYLHKLKFYLSILFVTIAFNVVQTHADVVVIIHPSNTAYIDLESVKKIFLGKSTTFSDKKKAIPIGVVTNDLRKEFNEKILQRSQGALTAHWSRMVFTGKSMPPKAYKTDKEVKELVANDPNYIGFIDKRHVDKHVKVVKFP